MILSDKERLDWLELNSEPRRRCFDDWYRVGFNSPGGKTIREAIDAAIEAQKSKIEPKKDGQIT